MKVLGICGTQKRGKIKSASEWFLKVTLKAAQEKGAETKIFISQVVMETKKSW